jgi:uncharacterized protein (DUF362 family)
MSNQQKNNSTPDDRPSRENKAAMTRRDFLKITSAVTLAAGTRGCILIKADESPTITDMLTSPTASQIRESFASHPTKSFQEEPSASPTPENYQTSHTAAVAFVKTTDRADGVRRALNLLGINPVNGKTVMLKPNLNSADETPGSTHNDVLRTLVESLWEMGAKSITVADRSGMGNTGQVMKKKGILDMAEELGFDTLILDKLEVEDWVPVQLPDSHGLQGFLYARQFLESDVIVQTCCLKTHRFGGHFTISLKNSVGMVAKHGNNGYNYMQELHSSPNQRKMIAEINTAYHPALVVIDAVEAFVSGGPDKGRKIQSGVVLAGTDRIALDAVGVAILRFFGTTSEVEQGRVFEQEQIAHAVNFGLGVSRPEDITLLTYNVASEAYAEQILEVLISS